MVVSASITSQTRKFLNGGRQAVLWTLKPKLTGYQQIQYPDTFYLILHRGAKEKHVELGHDVQVQFRLDQ